MGTVTTIVKGWVSDGVDSDSQPDSFPDKTVGLAGWNYRKPINYTGGSGAGTDYQLVVKCYYGSGTDGTESLNGETVAKVYLEGHAKTDFADVRFALQGSETAYVYKLTSKVDGDYAIFVVKVTESMDSARIIYVYAGNPTATSASSDNALIAKIDGVVAAYPLDEADQEVNPTVISDSNPAAYYRSTQQCSVENATIDGYNYLKITNGTITTNAAAFHEYGASPINVSAKTKLRIYIYGTNTGHNLRIRLNSPDWSNQYYYQINNNFSGRRLFDLPIGSFTVSGSPNLATLKQMYIDAGTAEASNDVLYVGRVVFDNAPDAKDYSGNGNDGAATGTTITDSPTYVGKKARGLNGVADVITALGTTFAKEVGVTLYFEFTPAVDYQTKADGWYGGVGSGLWDKGYWLGWSGYTGADCWVAGVETAAYPNNRVTVGGGKYTASNTYKIYMTIKEGTIKLYENGALKNTVSLPQNVDPEVAFNFVIGGIYRGGFLQGVIENVFQFAGEVDLSAISTGVLPDSSLVEGSVCVRKWASTTLPTVASIGKLDTRELNLAYKINEVTSKAEAAGKDYIYKVASKGHSGVAVIVTEA